METIEQIQREKEESRRFKKFNKHVNDRIPYYAAAVFSFRGRHYYGCGFHYDLEKRLGSVINLANNLDLTYSADKQKRFHERMMLEILFEELARDVARIKLELGEI